MSRTRGKWEYRSHWIDNNVPRSESFYAYWYDTPAAQRTGDKRRKSLKTTDFERAKDELIAFVLQKETARPEALIISVLAKYIDEVTSRLPSAYQAERAQTLIADAIEGHEQIRDLTEEFQIEKLLKPWREKYGHSAGYMARNLSVLGAAIGHCRIEQAPKVLLDPTTIAKKLRIPKPEAGKWFPNDDELARFIDGLNSEFTFRWIMIALNTACRPEAALDLSPPQVDFKHNLIDLNPPGRPQEPTKYRPMIRLTKNLAAWLKAWDVHIQDTKSAAEQAELALKAPWKLAHRYVPYRSIDSLQSVFTRLRVKDEIAMPSMVPYSIRNKIVTVLRIAQVPGTQRSHWLGHIDEDEQRTTSRSYGQFDPTYLSDAANATDEFLIRLDRLTDRNLSPK